jgi:hypothetical protein
MDAAAALMKDAQSRCRSAFGSTFVTSQPQLQRLQQAAQSSKNKNLQGPLVCAIGFHNAAMEPEDRAIVEALFKQGDLLVSLVHYPNFSFVACISEAAISNSAYSMPELSAQHSLGVWLFCAGALHNINLGHGGEPASALSGHQRYTQVRLWTSIPCSEWHIDSAMPHFERE